MPLIIPQITAVKITIFNPMPNVNIYLTNQKKNYTKHTINI